VPTPGIVVRRTIVGNSQQPLTADAIRPSSPLKDVASNATSGAVASSAPAPVVGFLRAAASFLRLNTPVAPRNPIGALLWGLLQGAAASLGVAPKAGTPTVVSQSETTGLVTGAVNFTNPVDGRLIYTVTIDPSLGTASVDATGTYTYTPSQAALLAAAGGTGPVGGSFTVIARNGIAATEVTVKVPIGPDVPVAGTPIVGTPSSVAGWLHGVAVFTDPAGLPLTYTLTTGPTQGSITDFHSDTGGFTYTPTVGVLGDTDTFTVTASNGLHSATQTISVPIAYDHLVGSWTVTGLTRSDGLSQPRNELTFTFTKTGDQYSQRTTMTGGGQTARGPFTQTAPDTFSVAQAQALTAFGLGVPLVESYDGELVALQQFYGDSVVSNLVYTPPAVTVKVSGDRQSLTETLSVTLKYTVTGASGPAAYNKSLTIIYSATRAPVTAAV
jgi:VCBS repeat-containing protein